MSTIHEQFEQFGVVPVVVLEDAKDAGPLAEALVKGGLPCAEVTFRTAAAEQSIKTMTDLYPNMLVGAGTVLSTDQVDRATGAGAKFIVSPGFDPEIVDYCIQKEIPVFPGCITPSGSGAGNKKRAESHQIFPSCSVWRRRHHQSARSPLYVDQIYADRRNQRKELKGLFKL